MKIGSHVGLERAVLLRRGLHLEFLTVGWNVVEGLVAVAAALAAGSIALLGFGIDSFVESASGGILIWRLRAEGRPHDDAGLMAIEHRARKLVAFSLAALAIYVAFDAAMTLVQRDKPDASFVGVALAAVSLVVMRWLARAKRRAATELGSAAMRADAFQTTLCMWLSLIVLAGIALNAVLGLWWADPVAALAIVPLIAREAGAAWRGKDCC